MSERHIFESAETFGAVRLAEAWCEERGISVGRMERGQPRGLMRGEYDIQKWHNLRKRDIAELDGRMTGDMRNGPVIVEIG